MDAKDIKFCRAFSSFLRTLALISGTPPVCEGTRERERKREEEREGERERERGGERERERERERGGGK